VKVIKSTESVFVDVDQTLVLHVTDGSEQDDDIIIKDVRFRPHARHIEQIRAHFARGHLVVVWSAGGYKWGQQVVELLGLEDSVDYVMSKPSWCIDDLEPDKWLKRYYYDIDGTVVVGDEDEKESTKTDNEQGE